MYRSAVSRAYDNVFGGETNATYGIVIRMGADSTDHTAQHGRRFPTDPEFSDYSRVPESQALMSPARLPVGTRWACSDLRSLRLNYLKAPSSESVNPCGPVLCRGCQ